METMIETRGLCKCYGRQKAVDDVNLHVPKANVYGFIGPNGAGKSTCMKMLLGLIRPTQGEVCLFGERMTEKNKYAHLKSVGSLIESPPGYLNLTARENLQIVADLKKIPRKDIEQTLGIVGLSQDKNRRVSQFSLGMKQRLGVAMAMLGDPALLILDEPTNGLDPAGIQEMRELIADMPRKTGTTVFVSSHLLGEIEQMADWVGIIHHGRMLFEGPLQKLQEHSLGSWKLRVLDTDAARDALERHGVDAALQGDGSVELPPLTEELLSQIVRLLAENGAGIVRINRQSKSLEEIFLSLTTTGKEVF